jgi:hypothetical protein
MSIATKFKLKKSDRYVRGKTVANAISAEVIAADPVSDMRRIAQAMLTHHLSAAG